MTREHVNPVKGRCNDRMPTGIWKKTQPYECYLCGEKFRSPAARNIHAEDCGRGDFVSILEEVRRGL
jgi:hypothetical protein